MGCVWSSRNSDVEERGCARCGRWLAGPNEVICTFCRTTQAGAISTAPTKRPLSRERLYGQFKCFRCKRAWSSSYAYENFGQKCLRCRILIRPYSLVTLEKSEYKKTAKHHEDLCELCINLGHPCCFDV